MVSNELAEVSFFVQILKNLFTILVLCFQDMQRDIRSLQGEILSMGHAAQELLAVANADSHDLIRHSLSNLNDRVHILEGQAKEQGDKLRNIDRQYKQYQVWQSF